MRLSIILKSLRCVSVCLFVCPDRGRIRGGQGGVRRGDPGGVRGGVREGPGVVRGGSEGVRWGEGLRRGQMGGPDILL